MNSEIDGKSRCVLVTGAANGIGKATAMLLARQGWRVKAVDIDRAGLGELQRVPGIATIEADVSKEQDIVQALAGCEQLDAIVSNAGVSEFKSLAESSLNDWNRVLSINLTAAFLLAKHAEPLLRKSKGSMVLVASTRAQMSEPDTHAYAASKGGLVALTHSLAISLGPDVRVNCISPGWIDVKGETHPQSAHLQHPAGRIGVPDDVAAMVAFLISDQSGFVTGAEFVIDGGMTRKMIYED
ncbi:SDR family oxidoreductase [Luteolibacter pohnpeiensis]|uniref:SDR family oxidoreductase n=1 Tax=Luteolibacter pohnpeiensis TaxID=454153 RepID=A0A934S415_9BACT|nr:SDR family oxidoreductase [Luteolibacter pohnpeiensis]MBK1881518.1 SDR family oxidoreductase [Luteolibacter pohnpeiensis]